MGANPTQALAVTAFLLGFVALSIAVYGGKVLFYLLAVLLVAASVVIFRKCKPYEEMEK
jgi:hypothetical protein